MLYRQITAVVDNTLLLKTVISGHLKFVKRNQVLLALLLFGC